MLGLGIFAVLEIDVVGDGASWVSLAGPAAIVFAAVIAALYARHRMGVEIAAADARLEKQLKHDREAAADRLEAQLRHDRELREREATRTTLDELAQLIFDTIESCTNLSAVNRTQRSLRKEIDAADQEGGLEDLQRR